MDTHAATPHRVALERLFTRFPALELAVPEQELAPHAGFVGNSVRALPVRLRPGRPAAVRSGADA